MLCKKLNYIEKIIIINTWLQKLYFGSDLHDILFNTKPLSKKYEYSNKLLVFCILQIIFLKFSIK